MQENKTTGWQKMGWGLVLCAVMLTAGGCATTVNTDKSPLSVEPSVTQPPPITTIVLVTQVKAAELPSVRAAIRADYAEKTPVYVSKELFSQWIGLFARWSSEEWHEFIASCVTKYKNNDYGSNRASKDRKAGYYYSEKFKQTIVIYTAEDEVQATLSGIYEANHAGK